ncbi:MAG: hypothetical protein AVDCRST_MAG43-1493 [uncultured Thermomicrobiales bacterium]|uniref:Uncharacterized protein n=1 Tax=uncultured Thermomicrobiales bacterium TaxID=1645740 RepID=A0A6J4UPH7_9BACT|nr:MAG: hypothetical protein AVDCRST_MAG43-1493 [uncultured Thermomicrobiales bacterium]
MGCASAALGRHKTGHYGIAQCVVAGLTGDGEAIKRMRPIVPAKGSQQTGSLFA